MQQSSPADVRGRGIACDACRARKVKCDRDSPCSNCRASKIDCRSTKGPLQKRQRILISPRYEDELAALSSRLAGIEKLLRETLGNPPLPSVDHQTSAGPSNHGQTSAGPSDHGQTYGSSSFEGESSFATNSIHTVLGLKTLVHSKEDQSAVASLQEKVYTCFMNSKDPKPAMSNQARTGFPLPPGQLVTKVLNYCKHNSTRFFRDYPFIHVDTFTKMCQQVYFPTEEYSLSVFVIVNSGLCNLLRDLDPDILHTLSLNAIEVGRSVTVCAANVKRAVVDLRLDLEPTIENILALLLSGTTRLDWSSPSYAWKLVSHAAILCQEAGYHRLQNILDVTRNDEIKQKRLIFWYVWGFDVMLSFNLGRSPTLHCDDITTLRPQCPEEIDAPWAHGLLSWLDIVSLQQEIYQLLYSGQAQMQPPGIKAKRANALIGKLISIRNAFFAGNDGSTAGSSEIDTIASESFELNHYSLLTLLYRMEPVVGQFHPLKFSDACISAARIALGIQNKTWVRINNSDDESWKLFIHWTVLCCPFVPFLVVFSNAIAARNEGDLQLLCRTVESLHPAAQQSPSIARVHQVFSTFLQFGNAWFESSHQEEEVQGIGEEQSNGFLATTDQYSTDLPLNAATDFLLQLPTWDAILNEWNPGHGEENAMEVSALLDNYFPGGFEAQD